MHRNPYHLRLLSLEVSHSELVCPSPKSAAFIIHSKSFQVDNADVEVFKERQAQYKLAALTCKRAGDIPQAKQFLAVSKVR